MSPPHRLALVLGVVAVLVAAPAPADAYPLEDAAVEAAAPAAAAAEAPAAAASQAADADTGASSVSQVVKFGDAGLPTVEDTAAPKNNVKRSQSGSNSNILAPLLQTPNVTPETVSLSPQIPDPQKKGNAVQGILLNLLQPTPIVDTIQEKDKYGNTGDKFAFIGRGVVAGFEGFSNILNRVLDFPFETAKKVSRSATEALNNLGSRLIGL